ncbi:MAG: glycerophosphoryl diester phosphodiesterase membrane domain-containing protein [Parasporobacterium sp.]|nr:glycerophosphoryl diester phosphodiesterase membrane domain-containing protein [Parasporobacterium sp.]
MKISDKLKSIWDTIRFNFGTTLLFVLIFTALNFITTYVIVKLYLNILCLLSGDSSYIAPSNLGSIVSNPVSWIVIIVFAIVITMMALFEVTGLVYIFSMSRLHTKIHLGEAITAAVTRCRRTIRPKNWPVMLFLLLMSPICSGFALFQSVLSVVVPEFISDFIFANTYLSIAATVLIIILFILFVYNVFALVIYAREDITFSAAAKKSRAMVKGRALKMVGYILAAVLVGVIVFFGISGAVSGITAEVSSVTGLETGSVSSAYTQMKILNIGSRLLFSMFMPVISLSLLVVLYEEFGGALMVRDKAETHRKGVSIAAFVIFAVIVSGLNIYYQSQFFADLKAQGVRPAIVSHRGDSVRAPENTMPAFELAMTEVPEYLEFDVHQTKDGVIVVSHDDYLQRVTGKDIYLHDLTWEEASQLDVGSWFSKEFEGLHFTTFDEALKYFKNYPDVTLQIEIKPTGFDNDLEQSVLDIINENDMHDRCMITSLNLETIQNVEKLDPEMITVYSMFVAYGNLPDIEGVDYFTIEQSNITPELVTCIHNAGKKCFAWTANTEETAESLALSGVDGILTDDPVMMKNTLNKLSYAGGFEKLLRYFVIYITNGF